MKRERFLEILRNADPVLGITDWNEISYCKRGAEATNNGCKGPISKSLVYIKNRLYEYAIIDSVLYIVKDGDASSTKMLGTDFEINGSNIYVDKRLVSSI